MKIGFAFAAVAVALDADYTDNLSSNLPTYFTSMRQCYNCDVTGTYTAETLLACLAQHVSNGLETCPDAASTGTQVCALSVTKNGSGQIIGLKTGCSEANSCNAQSRQNFVGGIGFLSQCKPDPTRWNTGRYRVTSSKCNTCMQLCNTVGFNCFDPTSASQGIFDGNYYAGFPTDPASWKTGNFLVANGR